MLQLLKRRNRSALNKFKAKRSLRSTKILQVNLPLQTLHQVMIAVQILQVLVVLIRVVVQVHQAAQVVMKIKRDEKKKIENE